MKNNSKPYGMKIYAPLAAIALSGTFYLFAPAHLKDKVVGLFTFASAERQCFNFHKQHLVDPESGYLDSSYVWTREDEQEYGSGSMNPKFDAMLRVKIFAKNRMGGYVSNYVECPLVNGQFDEHAAFMHRLGHYDLPGSKAMPAAAPAPR